MKKLRNMVPYYTGQFFNLLRHVISSVFGNMLCIWWNVDRRGWIGFYGLPMILKHYNGKISIGKGCNFRSAPWSNVAGINRQVALVARNNGTLTIGNTCGMSGTVIVAEESITIGNRVTCGVNCTIADTDFHPLDAKNRIDTAPGETNPIVIEDDVWLGMNVTVLKGVTIGKGTVVAANSVVTRSLPPGVVAAGIPAKPVKDI